MLIESILAVKPTNSIEWLMMEEGEEPPTDTDHTDAVMAALLRLSDESKFILMAIFFEQIPYEELGARLGVSKTHAWRLTNKAKNELKILLAEDPILKKRYNLFTTWNEACEATVKSFWRSGVKFDDGTFGWARNQLMEAWDLGIEPSTATYYAIATACLPHLEDDGFTAESMVELLCKKQHDYGHENISSFGSRGLVVRLVDKLARRTNLNSRLGEAVNEPLADTYADLFGYSVLGTMLLDDTFHLPLKEDANV